MKILLLGAFGFLFVLIWVSVSAGNHDDAPVLASDGSGYTVAETLPAPRASDVGRVNYASVAQAPEPAAPTHDPDRNELIHMKSACVVAVREKLADPDDAEGNYDQTFVWRDGDGFRVSALIVGRNAFNAKVANRFICVIGADGETVESVRPA